MSILSQTFPPNELADPVTIDSSNLPSRFFEKKHPTKPNFLFFQRNVSTTISNEQLCLFEESSYSD